MTALHSSSHGQHHHQHHLGPSAPWHYDDDVDEQSHENGGWVSSADFTSIPPAHAHPDLPSEPPGYDEFEFSFPTDLSPSLFSGLPLAFPDSPQSQQLGYSYTPLDDGTSRPSPKSDVPGYIPFASQHGLLPPLPPPPPLAAPVLQDARPAPISSTSHTDAVNGPSQGGSLTDVGHPYERGLAGPSSSLIRSRRLFEEDERSALDAFFDTLDAAPQGASSAAAKRNPSAQAGSRPAKKAKMSVVTETVPHEGIHSGTPGEAYISATPALVHIGEEAPSNTTSQPGLKAGANRRGRPPTGKIREPKARAPPKAAKGKDKDKAPAARSTSPVPSASAESSAILPGQAKTASAQANPDASTSAAAAAAAATSSKRSNHIASEQRRRTTIKENYKSLVDLLLAGELRSGISLSSTPGSTAPGGEDDDGVDEGADVAIASSGNRGTSAGAGSGGGRGKGRGRGRKGQDGAGATKSVVLERAADYLRWLERGNTALRREIESLEQARVH